MSKENIKAKMEDTLYKMILVRRFEEVAGDYYRKGYIGGFCHLYIGQEAVAVGTYSAITKEDKVITAYRDHAHIILAGTHPNAVMAELFGKETGVSKGKGGSMHLFDIKNNFYGGHGIVGAQVSLGTGLSFASKYKNENSAAFVFFGDGAAHQGQVYESFNMAKLWNLPVVYVIENNGYAMGTSTNRGSSIGDDLWKRGEGFNISAKRVNGMDFFEVEKAVKEAREFVLSGKGPMLLEMKTYRYRGHSMSDPAKYRTRDEVDKKREEEDPIEGLKSYILKNKILKEDEIKAIESRVEIEVEESVQFAINSKEPDLETLYTDVFV